MIRRCIPPIQQSSRRKYHPTRTGRKQDLDFFHSSLQELGKLRRKLIIWLWAADEEIIQRRTLVVRGRRLHVVVTGQFYSFHRQADVMEDDFGGLFRDPLGNTVGFHLFDVFGTAGGEDVKGADYVEGLVRDHEEAEVDGGHS